MNDLDLEDLESRLYSQVYHGAAEEIPENISNTNSGTSNLTKTTNNNMQKTSKRYFGPWNSGSKFQTRRDSPRPGRTQLKPKELYKNCDQQPNPYAQINAKKSSGRMNARERGRLRWKEKVKERIKQKKVTRMQSPNPDKTEKQMGRSAVIILSDSEDDSCVLIDNQWPVVALADSDDDNTTHEVENTSTIPKNPKNEKVNISPGSQSDDVIFVEPVVTPIEIINVDDENESHQKINETASSDNLTVTTPRKIHQERKELLSTPDSASNDFMTNSGVELRQENFNFSLHGSDFRSGEFLKPLPRTDTCETGSSSSTTDPNHVNLMNTLVFNEVDFPKDDIFSENNLESFGNFITPLRKNVSNKKSQSTPVQSCDSQNKSKNIYSDASSESDLEEESLNQKSKQLPELSPMQSKKDVALKKRKTTMASKYDLLNSECETPTNQKKKKKKNKKKKVEEVPDSTENVVEVEVKRKKRKSSQMEGTEGTENQKKKLVTAEEEKPPSKEETHGEDAPKNETVAGTSSVALDTMKQAEPDVAPASKSDVADSATLQYATIDITTEEQKFDPTLEGLIIVDETFDQDLHISDSRFLENTEILLNYEKSDHESTPSTSAAKGDLDNFNVKDIQLTMSNDPNLWMILESDRTPRRSRGPRCRRCKQFGHTIGRCREKMEIKCAMCGERGHYEPRCPNKICHQCGQRSLYSTTYCNLCFKFRNYRCELCSMPGHLRDSCPDLWRRYHLTTEEGPPVAETGARSKEKKQLWCSGCARAGHLEHSCLFYKSIYPPTDPFIKSHDDVYSERHQNEPRFVAPSQSTRAPRFVPRSPPQEPRFVHSSPLAPNYAINNQVFQPLNQGPLMSLKFNHKVFGQMNPQGMDTIFVANQQNFFPPVPTDMLQLQPQNQFTFENALPTYISFDTNASASNAFQEVPRLDGGNCDYKQKKTKAAHNAIFFSGAGPELHHFINEELLRLSKFSVLSPKLIKEMKQRRVPHRFNTDQREQYYETLNMLLFGVLLLDDGRRHLAKLKQFRRGNLKGRVTAATRKMLYKSYIYIFGRDKHSGVEYNELLRRI